MKLTENSAIEITFLVLVLLMIYFNYMGFLKTKLDIYISYVGIITALIVLLVKNTTMIDIAHFLYCVFLFFITFFSTNTYLLGLNIVILMCTIFSRYYYGVCILNNKQNNVGFFYNLAGVIAKLILNWTYVFILLLLISSVRFVRLIR